MIKFQHIAMLLLCIIILLSLLNNTQEGFSEAPWQQGLSVTHYYDCGGQSCDAPLLQPFKNVNFVAPEGYNVLDPNDFGGPLYGEAMWIYGAASDKLANILGNNIDGLGHVTESGAGGACGKSILIRNKDATRPDWTALVMRKSRCPPWSSGCNNALHMDLLVPGFDNLSASTANRCGDSNTALSKKEATVCGNNNAPVNCIGCHTISNKKLAKGCQLFVDWGWKTGNPECEWKIVELTRIYKIYKIYPIAEHLIILIITLITTLIILIILSIMIILLVHQIVTVDGI